MPRIWRLTVIVVIITVAAGALCAQAEAARHWAYVSPVLPPVPAVNDASWARHDLDRFVQARFEARGWAPSEEADRRTLLRRWSLDLIGLPPTPAELQAFVEDTAPDACERAVDRLLASPHYGEHQASRWLDLARYADTHGYESDRRRSIWPYRDWVIDAFNQDMPFDQFTIEQHAGDLLPGAGLSQRIATGFHRNSMKNLEGGVDEEEYRIEAIADRVETTAAVWLGTTYACARCHDHKYDPVTQKEYFQLFAYFNSSDEPEIEVISDEEDSRREDLLARVHDITETCLAATDQVSFENPEWPLPRVAWTPLDPDAFESAGGATLSELPDGSILAKGRNPTQETYSIVAEVPLASLTGIRLEALHHKSLPLTGPGRGKRGGFLLSGIEVSVAPRHDPEDRRLVSLTAARADYADTGLLVEGANRRVSHPLEWSSASSRDDLRCERCVVYRMDDPGVSWSGWSVSVHLEHQAPHPRVALGRFRLSVTSDAAPLRERPLPDAVKSAIEVAPDERDAAARAALFVYAWPLEEDLRALAVERDALMKQIPEPAKTLVLKEREAPRETFVHEMGNFLNSGERVEPRTPAFLPPPHHGPQNRLALARWLVRADHPLTARVTVNREWAHFFGAGLVANLADFGKQSPPPSHPELLDWLAVRFIEDGWSLKRLHRAFVLSATYRQASEVTPEHLRRDPANRFLARGGRWRVRAETVRDLALSVSGLLNPERGGPSVFPPQPEGIWTMIYSRDRWKTSTGPDRYRRGLYTFWRRTAPYPSLQLFDAPSREVTCTRRSRSSTPLQALVTLNDPAFIECARALAERLTARATSDEARLARGFELCTGREPSRDELRSLAGLLRDSRAHFATRSAAARELAERPESGAEEAAAWCVVANVLLNLDETVTRQ